MGNDNSAEIFEFPEAAFSGKQDGASSSSEEALSYSLENPTPKKIFSANQPIVTAELLEDLASLSKTALRKKYSREANSHKNRKSECKKNGGKFAYEIDNFSDFLLLIGVCPGPGKWTLDRIDNSNPDYFPGGVRWADAKTQNNNKSDTILLTHKGVTRPLTEWAEIVGGPADTLRKRHQRGWPDHQVIFGKPKAGSGETQTQQLGIWKRLVPEREAESYKILEAAYQRSKQPNHTGIESRQCWLAAVAIQHVEILKYELLDQDYTGTTDAELEFQYGFWTEVIDKINRELAASTGGSVSDYPHVYKGRNVGRISWRQ